MRGIIGVGFNWGKPNPISFADADDQYTTELFWRYQLTRELALTPSIQYIKDPALNPTESDLWAFGLAGTSGVVTRSFRPLPCN
jgi:porin